jgi:hypothetical protein
MKIDDLTQATEILRKHNASSLTFKIYGRKKLGATQEIVEAYRTRRSILTRDDSIIPCQTKLEVFAN